MFTQNTKQYAANSCAKALAQLPAQLAQRREEELSWKKGDLRVALEYLYGTLPFVDRATVPVAVMAEEAAHALERWREDAWEQALPERIFLPFVLCPRVNSENLEPCRRFFYEQLAGRVKGLSLEEAVLEVNRWCCEQVTYQASGHRTESPITAWRSGKGRCGEESTFVVAALRSLGIAARQVYAPWWSHCDDNHAWVEAYVHGEWRFLGACEPEPVLNRGWFLSASSRAMLVHTRAFTGEGGEALLGEELVERREGVSLYNETSRYAPTRRLTLTVRDESGVPAVGAQLELQVLNMAAFRTVAQLRADDRGRAALCCGRGSFHLEARWGECCETLEISPGEDLELAVTVRRERPCLARNVDFYAPPPCPRQWKRPTEEQLEANRDQIHQAAGLRAQRQAAYFRDYCAQRPEAQGLERPLRASCGNVEEIGSFLLDQPESRLEWARHLVDALEEKDLRDSTAKVLESHLEAAMAWYPRYRGREADFISWVLSPRIGTELIRPWRRQLWDTLSPEERRTFSAQPEKLAQELARGVEKDRWRQWSAIVGVEPKERDTLFVALARTLGVCARLNPVTEKAEYLTEQGPWQPAWPQEGERSAFLTLRPGDRTVWSYEGNWSLSRWERGRFVLLTRLEAGRELSLAPGRYRLVTTNRLPNGNQLARIEERELAAGEKTTWILTVRQARTEELLQSNPLMDFVLENAQGGRVSASSLCQKEETLFAFLQVGAEPTEHFLNELRENCAKWAGILKPVLILRRWADREDPTLGCLLEACPGLPLYVVSSEDSLDMTARGMFLDPASLPVVVLTHGGLTGIYGHCGYTVGGVELALKVAQAVKDQK